MIPAPHEHLLSDAALARSEVVANSTMNRERGLLGRNSYALDLSFDVLASLRKRLQERGRVAWLDLCCGTGRALIEAGVHLNDEAPPDAVEIRGVDLVEHFAPVPAGLEAVRMEAASLSEWQPERAYDLITCVHGLHYVGDKLGLISRAVSWLEPDGLFLAHLDLDNLRLEDGRPHPRRFSSALKAAGLRYDSRKKLLAATGGRRVDFPLAFLGADDRAGPNYTGQPAVSSWYRDAGAPGERS
ncbi:MAG: class I SAM-dependent methyltransferase [Armatimonadota bacterium]